MQPIISPNIRIRYPEHFYIGKNSIIDDYCYFSTQVHIERFSHIASHVTVAGGKDTLFKVGDCGGLASGVRVFCGTDDFVNDLATILPPELNDVKNHVIKGDVILKDFVTIGSNSVVMPKNIIPEGTCIGALSFVPSNFQFEEWSIYAGWPKLRLIKKRNKENVMRQVQELNRRIDNK